MPDAGAGRPLVGVRERARDHAALQRVPEPIVSAVRVSALRDVAGAAGAASAGVLASPRDLHGAARAERDLAAQLRGSGTVAVRERAWRDLHAGGGPEVHGR